ncbi:hypothetical protein Tco_1100348, partial [Tanacetum coccineum]
MLARPTCLGSFAFKIDGISDLVLVLVLASALASVLASVLASALELASASALASELASALASASAYTSALQIANVFGCMVTRLLYRLQMWKPYFLPTLTESTTNTNITPLAIKWISPKLSQERLNQSHMKR